MEWGNVAFAMVLVVVMCFKGSEGNDHENRLVKKLMDGYTPSVRPVHDFKDIVTVNFSLALQQIIDLDEKNQILTTSIYMTTAWHDVHLHWKPEEYGNITSVRLSPKKVWKPDVLVYNSVVDSFDQILQTNVIVHSDGTVEWLPPGVFKTTCDVNILYFPFDEQRCALKFGAWTHHGYLDTPFTDGTFTLHIKRRSIFYAFNLILPCILVCSLSILIFVLPADSGERMTLGITVLLAMVVFLQIVADNLPPTGVIPLLGKYFACSIIMVTMSVVASVFSMNLHHTTSANSDGMPRWMELMFLVHLPKFLFMKMPQKEGTQNRIVRHSSTGGEDVPLVRVGERLGNFHNELHDNKNAATTLAMQLKHSEKQIAKMCGDLHDIVQRMRDDEEDEEIAIKWRFAARVLDRFCLIFFVIFFMLSTLLTIGIAPGVLLQDDSVDHSNLTAGNSTL